MVIQVKEHWRYLVRNYFHKLHLITHLQWNSFVVHHHSRRGQNPHHNVGKMYASQLESCKERQIYVI